MADGSSWTLDRHVRDLDFRTTYNYYVLGEIPDEFYPCQVQISQYRCLSWAIPYGNCALILPTLTFGWCYRTWGTC